MKRNASTVFVCVVLALVSVACYWPITGHGFIVFDDPTYVYQNEHVKAGLTWAGVVWAFTTGYASNWHPLTWISHMMDGQCFGLNPGGHHFTSLLIHAFNSALLFVLLKRMTGAFWRSALVAALFAWHPLHVESVAWAAERKDVLSALFWLLTMLVYVRYVKESEVEASSGQSSFGARISESSRAETSQRRLVELLSAPFETSRSKRYYWLAVLLFALGLMSKPMLVTLPCALLLIDIWPLERIRISSLRSQFSTLWPLLLEKAPFFTLGLAASVVTFLVQRAGGAVSSLTTVSPGLRVSNALVAYVRYLLKTVWPADLSVFYPLPEHWPLLAVVGSGLLLVGLSLWVMRSHRRFPFLAVGWFWFLGTLVPTIGLVQVGSQSMADRYTYIPSIGLFIIVAWGLRGLAAASPRLKLLVPTGAAAALVACLSCTVVQVGYWENEEKLFQHAMEVTPDNYMAHDHLAKVYEDSGRNDDALASYRTVVQLKPKYLEGRYNLGTLLLGLGRVDEAIAELQTAVKLKPQFAQAQSNLGIALLRQNLPREAIEHLETAVRLNPQDPDAHSNLGIALLSSDRAKEAAASFSNALKLAPAAPETHFLLAFALSRDHRASEAARQAEKARDLALAAGRQEIASKASDLLRICVAHNPLPNAP